MKRLFKAVGILFAFGVTLLMLGGIFGAIGDGFKEGLEASTNTPVAESTPTPTETPSQTAEPTPKPIETTKKVNIEVTSQIVKKVDGKCRYFFGIRNQDAEDFTGDVNISLYNKQQQSPIGSNTFSTASPIKPGYGDSVYLDTNTCPTSEHGAYGMTDYKYTVTVDGKEVSSGEGQITDSFEDLDSFDF